MAVYQRFASLPDLDLAPAIYETPSTEPSDNRQRSSNQIPEDDQDQGDQHDNDPEDNSTITTSHTSGIVRHQLKPSQARNTFAGASVDARHVDFSDRLDGRRSHRLTTKKSGKRRDGGFVLNFGDGDNADGDAEEEESTQARIARLLREVEEVKGEVERGDKLEEKREGGAKGPDGGDMETVVRLGALLKSLQVQTRTARNGVLHKDAPPVGLPSKGQESKSASTDETIQLPASEQIRAQTQAQDDQQVSSASQPSSTQKPTDPNLILAKATNLEARLAALERILGTHPPINPNSNSNASTNTNTNGSSTFSKASNPATSTSTSTTDQETISIHTSLTNLESLLTTLTQTTSPVLTTLSSTITSLTQDAVRLEETRKAATKAAEDAAKAQSRLRMLARPGHRYAPPPPPSTSSSITATSATSSAQANNNSSTEPLGLDATLSTRVTALHAHLPTIEAMAPLLPHVIERLRTLRSLHTEAAMAEERLGDVERRQGVLAGELTKWREVLERVEGRMEEGRIGEEANRGVVEAWVRELEGRVEALGGKEGTGEMEDGG